MFSSPLEDHISPAKNAIADRLQWARNSIRKKLDMNGHQQAVPKPVAEHREEEAAKLKPLEPEPIARTEELDSGLSNCDTKQSRPVTPNVSDPDSSQTSATSSTSSPIRTPERLTLTHGDPLGALDRKERETPPVVPASSFFSSPLRPFVLPDIGIRLFTTQRDDDTAESGEDVTSESESEESRDSETESEEDSDHSEEDNPALDSRLFFKHYLFAY